jgi:hypothetical protein
LLPDRTSIAAGYAAGRNGFQFTSILNGVDRFCGQYWCFFWQLTPASRLAGVTIRLTPLASLLLLPLWGFPKWSAEGCRWDKWGVTVCLNLAAPGTCPTVRLR